MPNLNGAELVRAVRAKYPRVPVVYISGYASGSQGEWLADPAQACALVRKSFLPQHLLEVAKRMMRSSVSADSEDGGQLSGSVPG